MDAGATGGHGFQATMRKQETGRRGLVGRSEGAGKCLQCFHCKRQRVPLSESPRLETSAPPTAILFGVSCVAGGLVTV